MGPHEKAEIQCKALRCGKNVVFSKDTRLQIERVWSKVTPRKVGVRLKWSLAWRGLTEKEASYLLGLRGRHQRSNQNRAPCVASTAVGTKGEENQMVTLSA